MTKDKASELRGRMTIIRSKMKRYQHYMALYEDKFGKQTKKQKEKIRNVVDQKSSDEQITINFEKLLNIKK